MSWVLVTEIFSPPNNISVHCTRSHCLIQWEKPKTRHNLPNWEFKYQLDIQKQVSGLCPKQDILPQGAGQQLPCPT